VWPPLQPLAQQLCDAISAALDPDEERRQRAAGAALGPWDALDEGLAVVPGRSPEDDGTPVSGSPPA
jgi:hypothetical protein